MAGAVSAAPARVALNLACGALFMTVYQQIIYGTAAFETILGTALNEIIKASSGDDYIWGEAGDDRLFGGLGDDILRPATGNDVIDGGEGSDTLDYRDLGKDGLDVDTAAGKATYGGWTQSFISIEIVRASNYADTMQGGDGDDVFYGRRGNDKLYGGYGNDRMEGDWDDDLLDGGAGADKLYGGLGNDFLYGGQGNDALNGGEHRDRLFGGRDNDVLNGGGGRDWLEGGHGNDLLRGEAHEDTFAYHLDERLERGADGYGSGRDVVLDFARGVDKLEIGLGLANGTTAPGLAAFDSNGDGRLDGNDAFVAVASHAANGVAKASLVLDLGAAFKDLGGADAYLAEAGAHMLTLYGVTGLDGNDFGSTLDGLFA